MRLFNSILSVGFVVAVSLLPLQWVQAIPLLNDTSQAGIYRPSPDSYTTSFVSGAGPALVNTKVNGYLTLDGLNCCTDILNLYLDNILQLSITADLGGGGSFNTYYNLASYGNYGTYGFSQGGYWDIFSPLTLGAGIHTWTVEYTGSPQGINDEAWSVEEVSVFGPEADVPEPETYTMLLAGLGLLGFAARGRKQNLAA